MNERERGRGRSQRPIVLSAGRPHAASALQGVKKDARNQEDCKSQLRLLNGRQQRRRDKQKERQQAEAGGRRRKDRDVRAAIRVCSTNCHAHANSHTRFGLGW